MRRAASIEATSTEAGTEKDAKRMTTENPTAQVTANGEACDPKVLAAVELGEDVTALEPDLEFIEEISRMGGDTFEKCYQCATCSGTCPISPEQDPFPRKEMVWSMWGLQDRLVRDPDAWLCYQCNDCSANCPRGGNPGDMLAIIRTYAYKFYAYPAFMGKLFTEPKYFPVILGIPILILLVVLGAFGHLNIPDSDPIVFADFFPYHILDPLFILVALIATVCTAISAFRFWKGMLDGPRKPLKEGHRTLAQGAVAAVQEIVKHTNFSECGKSQQRFYSHLLTFYGYLALFATTTLVFVGIYVFGLVTPMPQIHPVKILGNLGAIAFLIGTGMMLFARLTDEEKSGQTTYADWLFIGLMLGLAATGILTEVLRLVEAPGLAYPMYFIHLVLVMSMMGYFPYSKFAHMMYRVLAIFYYQTYCVRAEQPAPAQAAEAGPGAGAPQADTA